MATMMTSSFAGSGQCRICTSYTVLSNRVIALLASSRKSAPTQNIHVSPRKSGASRFAFIAPASLENEDPQDSDAPRRGHPLAQHATYARLLHGAPGSDVAVGFDDLDASVPCARTGHFQGESRFVGDRVHSRLREAGTARKLNVIPFALAPSGPTQP